MLPTLTSGEKKPPRAKGGQQCETSVPCEKPDARPRGRPKGATKKPENIAPGTRIEEPNTKSRGRPKGSVKKPVENIPPTLVEDTYTRPRRHQNLLQPQIVPADQTRPSKPEKKDNISQNPSKRTATSKDTENKPPPALHIELRSRRQLKRMADQFAHT
ncbi:hypothetical protein SpCBS45565_g00697 [Spizellomyces sp. 'palustris']|nr:hypothetical protein SpCBS45565_g00697 [Spizellomyces sp. 'palustris']